MRKSENFKNRAFALVTTGIIGLTSITGCTAKTNTDDTTAYTTVPSASITTTLEPTTTPTTEAVVSQDVATEDYRIHARAVAKAASFSLSVIVELALTSATLSTYVLAYLDKTTD